MRRSSLRRRLTRRNPLTGKEDLGLAFLGLATVALVGYALYQKMNASTAAGVNPGIQTAPNFTTQEAYDAWVMQQIQLGNVTPAQASAGGVPVAGG